MPAVFSVVVELRVEIPGKRVKVADVLLPDAGQSDARSRLLVDELAEPGRAPLTCDFCIYSQSGATRTAW